MKKIFLFLTLIFTCFSFAAKKADQAPVPVRQAEQTSFFTLSDKNAPDSKPIKTLAVFVNGEKGVLTLYGASSDGTFYTNVYANVKTADSSYDVPLADGYSPDVWYLNFTENEKFLFFSSQTGGSGGYGNYSVVRLKSDTYDTLYTNVSDSENNKFTAKFIKGGKIILKNLTSGGTLKVDVSYMDKEFYDQIFTAKGKVLGEQPYVNDVSFVAPLLNGATGVYDLITYRSVAAVAEVNRLGYITQNLSFTDNGSAFKPYFTSFSIDF